VRRELCQFGVKGKVNGTFRLPVVLASSECDEGHQEVSGHEKLTRGLRFRTAAPHAADVPSSKYVEVVEFMLQVLIVRDTLQKTGRKGNNEIAV
jgi:hypothetical protein